jgi:hypothetical protein
VIDCSRVGGDNARLFGAMCISRYYVDATGRQGTPRDQRRPHFLIVDEVPTFDTEALRRILDEGRKFGLALVTASQSLRGMGERLRDSVLTNAGVIALISPGPDDVSAVRRLYDPLTPDDLLGLQLHEFVVRMPGGDGRPAVYGGMVRRPPEGDPAMAEAIVAQSDARDGRDPAAVREEVRRRSGGDRLTGSGKPANGPSGRTRSMGEARAMATKWHRAGPTRAIPVPRNRAASGFLLAGTARMNSASRPRAVRPRRRALDIGLLGLADRAALRLLHRILITIPDQLSTLVYSSRRTAYRHLARLARLDLVEVVPLPPRRGGVPFAYRLTGKALRRLGYTRRGSAASPTCVMRSIRSKRSAPSFALPGLSRCQRRSNCGFRSRSPGTRVSFRLGRTVSSYSSEPGSRQSFVWRSTKRRSTRRRSAPSSTPGRPSSRFDRSSCSCSSCRPRAASLGCAAMPELEGALPSKVDRSASWPATSPPPVWKRRPYPSAGVANAGPGHAHRRAAGRRSGTPVGSAAWVELLGSGGGEDVDRVLFDSAAGDEDRKRDAR